MTAERQRRKKILLHAQWAHAFCAFLWFAFPEWTSWGAENALINTKKTLFLSLISLCLKRYQDATH